jgi:hypothetical protein
LSRDERGGKDSYREVGVSPDFLKSTRHRATRTRPHRHQSRILGVIINTCTLAGPLRSDDAAV